MTNRLMYFRKAVLRASASAIVVSTGLVPMTAHAQDAAASEPQCLTQKFLKRSNTLQFCG